MKRDQISETMENYLSTKEVAGGALIIRKDGDVIYRNKWGYSNVEEQKLIEDDTIFRIASMTKIVTAVAVMKLYEEDKIGLDDEVRKYIPEFTDPKVVVDKRFVNLEELKHPFWKMLTFNYEKVKTAPAERGITIRDLLSHSSGLELGAAGYIALLKMKYKDDTLKTRVQKYAKHPLDFQPGTAAGYSPTASFDVLARIIEIISGVSFADYLKREIFEPLEMKDATFRPTGEQWKRVAQIYKPRKGKHINMTGTKEDIDFVGRIGPNYFSGSAGLYCTIDDFDNLGQMLCAEGRYRGKQFLKSETIKLMHTEAALNHLEFEPGMVWGLGMLIRQDPEEAESFAKKDTYGWSGHYGTHFFVSPEDKLQVVFMMARSDIGGWGSYIIKKVEELVFAIYGDGY
jgi:CubicO group peptidase (beta-lactamase class C family)